jgi:hypothetical protein
VSKVGQVKAGRDADKHLLQLLEAQGDIDSFGGTGKMSPPVSDILAKA